MPIIMSDKGEREGIMQATNLILISARTAPKSGGVDDILTAIVFGQEKDSLVSEMEKIAEERQIIGFKRDAGNLRHSEAVILIGVHGTKTFGLNCGSCGYSSCYEFEKTEKKRARFHRPYVYL